MRLIIVASKGCPHCVKYAREAGKYVPVNIFDLAQIKDLKRQITGVPYSLLYDDNTLLGEWQGANLRPLFDLLDGPKMKIRFTRECRDKYTLMTYKKGSVKEFLEERAKELIEAGMAKEVKRADHSKQGRS